MCSGVPRLTSGALLAAPLPIRWGRCPVTKVELAAMNLSQLFDKVATFLGTHRGLNVLRLPRGSSATWGPSDLAVELDRARLGLRSVEVYSMDERDGISFLRHGPSVIHDQALFCGVPLERAAPVTGAPLGAAAITRLVFANQWVSGFAEASSLAHLQRLFPALRDLSSACPAIVPSAAQPPRTPLRPFRALHVVGCYNFRDHPEFIAAVHTSPTLMSLAAKEIAVSDALVDSLPEICPQLRHCYLEDCRDFGDMDPVGWKERLVSRIPNCSIRILPDFPSLLSAMLRGEFGLA